MDGTQKMLDRFVNVVTIIEAGGKQLTKEPLGVLPFPTTPYHFPGA
jgi:hypothetical protein